MTRRLVIPAVLLGFLAGAAPASAHHVACGDMITQDTKLDSDLICAGDEGNTGLAGPDALEIGAAGVTLDLGGHTISGPGAESVGVRAYGRDFTIRRGTIRGFYLGVDAPAVGTDMRRLAITNNLNGVVVSGFDVVVRNNLFADNSDFGLHLSDAHLVRVTGNDALRNGGDGIHFGGEVSRSVAEDNFASGNGDDGIEVSEIDRDLDGNPIPERNNAVARNLATHNGDLGIQAVAGTVDGGGNRAFGNGNPLQCLNIVCK